MEQAVRRVAQRVSGDGRDVEHLDSLLERKGLEGAVDRRVRVGRSLEQVRPRRRAKGLDEPSAGMVRVLRIGRKKLEGTAHVLSSLLQGSSQARLAIGDDVGNVALGRPVLLNRYRLKRAPQVRLVLERTNQGALDAEVEAQEVARDAAFQGAATTSVLRVDDVKMDETATTTLPRKGLHGRKGALRTAKGTGPRIEPVGVVSEDRRPPDVALGVDISIRALWSGVRRMLRRGRRGRGRRRQPAGTSRLRLLRKVDVGNARASGREGHRQQERAETTRATTHGRQSQRRGEGHGRRGRRGASRRPARTGNGRMQAAGANVLHLGNGAHMARPRKRHILDGDVRRTDDGTIGTLHAEVEVAVQSGRHASSRQHMAEDRMELHGGVDAGLRGEAVETNTRSTEGRVGSRQRRRRRRRDQRRRR